MPILSKSTTRYSIILLSIFTAGCLFTAFIVWEWWNNRQAEPVSSPANDNSITFDYYILAISWSPDYCADTGASDPQQCSTGKKLGFVLHGLWPEYIDGYPSFCSSQKLPSDAKTRFPGLYPNDSLYTHEWEKHGTCSGLGPLEYLAFSKKLKDSLVIPPAYRSPTQPFRTTARQLEEQFAANNSGLGENSLAVFCSGSGRFFSELYVCYTHSGNPTPCSADINKDSTRSCQSADFLVRNVR